MDGWHFLRCLSYLRGHPKDTARLERRIVDLGAKFLTRAESDGGGQPYWWELCPDLISDAERPAIEAFDKRRKKKPDGKELKKAVVIRSLSGAA